MVWTVCGGGILGAEDWVTIGVAITGGWGLAGPIEAGWNCCGGTRLFDRG